MKLQVLQPLRRHLPAGFAVVLSLIPALAKDTVTPAVGFLRFDCLPGSDTHVSVPFQRPSRWSGRLGADPAIEEGGLTRLTLAGNPAFGGNELLASPHLLWIRDSPTAAGRYFPIVAHGSSTLDVIAETGDLPGVTEGDSLSVVPAWTLAALFPPATQTTFHPSTGPLASGRGSELLFFNEDGEGSGLAPSRRFFVTSSGWIEAGAYTSADDVVVLPGQVMIVRHRQGAAATTFVPFDEVVPSAVSLPIATSDSSAREAHIAPPRPVPATLDQLGLTAPVFVESATTAPGDRKDELLVFDGSAPALNRSPSATYFRSGGQWLQDATGFPVSGTISIEPSDGLLIRKASGSATTVFWWTNEPNYDLTAP